MQGRICEQAKEMSENDTKTIFVMTKNLIRDTNPKILFTQFKKLDLIFSLTNVDDFLYFFTF